QWSETRIIRAPNREVVAGDRLVLGVGLGHRLKVRFVVEDAQRPRRLALHIGLPFGVTNHEVIAIAPVDPEPCRVHFNWGFRFPPGWRGRLTQVLLGRLFLSGPADSLRRLKRMAERR